MAVTASDRFLDDDGSTYVFERESYDDGGWAYYLTLPSGERVHLRHVRPTPHITRRPVDADAPLPLEIP